MIETNIRKISEFGVVQVLELLGIKNLVAEIYIRILFHAHRMTGPYINIKVNETEAVFRILTINEYRHFKPPDLAGEVQVIRDMLSNLEDGDVFYDIGANMGKYSCLAANNSDITTFAFEPSNQSICILNHNITLNGNEVQVIQSLVGDNDGHVREIEQGSLTTDNLKFSTEIDEVKIDTLVERGMESPDIVKVDVDGDELSVIRGMRKTLSKSNSLTLYIEIHESFLSESEIQSLMTVLNKSGFELAEIQVRERDRTIKAIK